MQFALAAELVFATHLETAMHPFGRVLRIGAPMPQLDLLGQYVESHPADLADRAGEVLVDHLPAQADRLKACAPV